MFGFHDGRGDLRKPYQTKHVGTGICSSPVLLAIVLLRPGEGTEPVTPGEDPIQAQRVPVLWFHFAKLETRERMSRVEMGSGSHLPFLHPPRSPAWSPGTFCAPDARNLPSGGGGVDLSAPSPALCPSPSSVWGLSATPAPGCIQHLVLFLGARPSARRPPLFLLPPLSGDQTPAPREASVNRLPRAKARALFNAAPQLPPDL